MRTGRRLQSPIAAKNKGEQKMKLIEKMKRKTYRNFLVVWNLLQQEKGYDRETARKLAHMVFENAEANPGQSINRFYDRILSKEEYTAECAKEAE
jgi:hypothetical protein